MSKWKTAKHKGFQCKHVPTAPILKFLLTCVHTYTYEEDPTRRSHWSTHLTEEDGGRIKNSSAKRWDGKRNPKYWSVPMPKSTPYKVRLAKMRNLVRRGYVEGCTCGCRGDWVITNHGIKALCDHTGDPYPAELLDAVNRTKDGHICPSPPKAAVRER